MSIYEVEPRFRLGLINLGTKLGEELPEGTQVSLPVNHKGVPHTRFVRVINANEIRIDAVHPECIPCGGRTILSGSDINLHALVNKKMRWLP